MRYWRFCNSSHYQKWQYASINKRLTSCYRCRGWEARFWRWGYQQVAFLSHSSKQLNSFFIIKKETAWWSREVLHFVFVKTACLYQNAPVKTAWLCKHIAAEISSLSPPSMFDGQALVFDVWWSSRRFHDHWKDSIPIGFTCKSRWIIWSEWAWYHKPNLQHHSHVSFEECMHV